MPPRKPKYQDEEAFHIDDDDGGTEGALDPCDKCGCSRADHEDDDGACVHCRTCHEFKEP